MDEYGSAPDENYNAIPVADRLDHKNWKARVSAYEELATLFRTSVEDNDFRRFEGSLRKIALDSNAVAQESGLTTLIQFVDNAPNPTKTKETVVPAVVEKCLSSTRAGTKAKAVDLILLYIEVGTPDPVIEDVLPGLEAKLPKLVASTTGALTSIIRTYGIKDLNVRPIVKKLPALFGHSDKNVRAEATNLTIELYRWLGKALDNSISELKPVQQKELGEAFEKLGNEKPTPERIIRSQRAAVEAAAAAAEEAGDMDVDDEDESMAEVDALDLIDPVNVLGKMEGNFYEMLASKKWQERKEALDNLSLLCKSPKIVDGNFNELVGALGKRMADTNINIVIVAANCLEGLALGLKKEFNRYRTGVATLVMDRLKERKTQVVEALAGALNAMYSTATFTELLEESGPNIVHKNPQIRAEIVKLYIYALKEIRIVPTKVEVKVTCEMLVKSFDDGDAAVREATAEALGTLLKCCGEKALLVYLEKIEAVKVTKLKEYAEKAVVKAKAAPVVVAKPAAPPPKVAAKAPVKKAPAASAEPAKKVAAKPAAAAVSAKKPIAAAKIVTKAAPAATAAGAKKPAPAGKTKEEEPLRYKFNSEDAEERASDFLPANLMADFGSSNWKDRLAAMETLQNLVESSPHFEAELITRVLSKKPGWKESNFQVTAKMFGIFQLQAESLSTFSKACAALTIPAMIDKMGDIKLKKAAGDCLTVYAEKISLQFVLNQAYDPLKKLKAPKALADSLVWMKQQLEDFGIVGLQVRELIDFLKFALASANAAVRSNAVALMGTLRRFVGPGIRSFVEDCNPSLLATIDAEFAKVADLEPLQATKASVAMEEEGGGGGAAASMDELFPKVDISNQFTSALMEECGDVNWKVRKEGLEKVAGIVAANQRIKPNLGGLPAALKLRLADSNKNLQILAMEICTSLANAMGKPFDKYARMLCPGVASCLTDQKENMRAAAITALDAFATQSGLDALVSPLAVTLVTNSVSLRKDMLVWLTTFCTGAQEKDINLPDLAPLIPPILQCLQDKSPDVRKAGTSFLPILMGNTGYDAIVAKCSDLKGATKAAIMPMLDAAKPAPPPRPPSVAKVATLNVLPSLAKPGMKAGAKLGASALPGAGASKIGAARPVSGMPQPSPTLAPPQIVKPLTGLGRTPDMPGNQLPSIAGPTGMVQPRSRLVMNRAGGMSPEPGMYSGMAPPRVSRLQNPQNSQQEFDEFSVPQPNSPYQPRHGFGQMPMQQQSFQQQAPFQQQQGFQTSQFQQQQGFQAQPMSGFQNNQMMGDNGEMDMMGNPMNNNFSGSHLPMPNNNSSASVMNNTANQIKRMSVSGLERREFVMDFLITQITSDDPHQSIDALKQLEKALQTSPNSVDPNINELVNALTLQIRLAYTGLEHKNNSTTRVCKHLVNALVSIFSNKVLAVKVSAEMLHRLLYELASRLLDKNLDKVESGQQLAKALNVTMVKVLENSNRNYTFNALLLILVNCAQPLRANSANSPEETAHQAKFGDLIMKCIWKLTKAIKECVTAGTLKPDELLADMNDFLVAIPPPEWKRRAQEGVALGDMPLRTVKTVLVELSSGLGEGVFDHLSLIHDPQRSAIHQYLVHMTGSKKRPITQVLNPATQPHQQRPSSMIGAMTNQNMNVHNQMMQQQQQQQLGQQLGQFDTRAMSPSPRTPTMGNFGGSNIRNSPFQDTANNNNLNFNSNNNNNNNSFNTNIVNNNSVPPMTTISSVSQANQDTGSMSLGENGQISETDANTRLTQIFTKIGTREETKQGISDLYVFQKMYPHMESKVNAQLSKTGTFFQSYIRRGLANLDTESGGAAIPTGITNGHGHGAGSSSDHLMPPGSNGGSVSGMSAVSSPVQSRSEIAEATAASLRSKRESVMSESGGGEASESYKERLIRLQQMFGYKSSSGGGGSSLSDGPSSPVASTSSPTIAVPSTLDSNGLVMTQAELDYQQHQFQQQQILAQHSIRPRPTSIYPTTTTASSSSTISPSGSLMESASLNPGGSKNGSGSSLASSPVFGTSSLSNMQSQDSSQQQERAQTVAMMKERLARMKSQTMSSSQRNLNNDSSSSHSGMDTNGHQPQYF